MGKNTESHLELIKKPFITSMTKTHLSFLAHWDIDFPEAIAALNEAQRDAAARRARLTLTEAPLSIGVMGQVKAGKSSFLNSLLFGGQALLLLIGMHLDDPAFALGFLLNLLFLILAFRQFYSLWQPEQNLGFEYL